MIVKFIAIFCSFDATDTARNNLHYAWYKINKALNNAVQTFFFIDSNLGLVFIDK